MQESGYNMTKMENMQLIFAAKCVHNLESTLKECSILTLIWVGFLGVRFEVGMMGEAVKLPPPLPPPPTLPPV